jgi:ubiquinone/menaquinone biosynthesis C-methylase UbiE
MTTTLNTPETVISPEPLYQIAMGFAATKTLLAAHRLGLFASLADGSKSADTVAQERSLPRESTEMLLNACVSLKLCVKEDGCFANSPLVEHYLTPERPGYLGGFFDHFNDHMYPAWFYLEEAVRSGHAQIQRVLGEGNDHFFQAIDRKAQNLETFMETMEKHSLLEGDALARCYDFSKHRELLDVGGGTGAMTVAILKRYPHLRATIFDRPPVGEITQRHLQQQGLSHRVRVVGVDFFVDALPTSADVLLLSGILHNWSPSNAKRILSQCAEASKPGTPLLISEQVLQPDKTGPLSAVLCSLNMLVMMEGGQEYSGPEFMSMLEVSGFRFRELRPTTSVRQLLIADKI